MVMAMAVVMVMVPDWPHGAPEPVTYCFGCFFTVSLWAVALIAPGRKGDNFKRYANGGGDGAVELRSVALMAPGFKGDNPKRSATSI